MSNISKCQVFERVLRSLSGLGFVSVSVKEVKYKHTHVLAYVEYRKIFASFSVVFATLIWVSIREWSISMLSKIINTVISSWLAWDRRKKCDRKR